MTSDSTLPDFDLLIKNGMVVTADEKIGVINKGQVAIKNGKIVGVGNSLDSKKAKTVIDANGDYVLPGFVDCHTHLMEFAPEAVHHVLGRSRDLSISALVFEALSSGITSLGEHNLGHPVVREYPSFYKLTAQRLPLNVRVAAGIAVIGTDPISIVSAVAPGARLSIDEVDDRMLREIARLNEFPGENIFPTATTANLPASQTPNAGKIVIPEGRMKEIVSLFHHEASRIGAHIQGTESMQAFVNAGGDVIHHAHGLDEETAELASKKGTNIVMTPAAGTGVRPNSPEDILMAYKAGVEISLATDCYIPLHQEASWVQLPASTFIGPQHFFNVIQSGFKKLKEAGAGINELLQLITRNPARILGLDDQVGSISIGKRADVVISRGFPGLDLLSRDAIRFVIKDGTLEIQR